MPNTTKQKKIKRKPFRAKRAPKGERGGFQLLLIQSVDKLGKQGDVVEVKRGYAVNYLIPQGLATIATEHHKRMVEKHKAQLAELERDRLLKLQAIADQIKDLEVNIEANASDSGQLYGSVTAQNISAALKAKGYHVVPEQIVLEGPLKELGRYTIKARLGSDIETEFKVWVVPVVTADL